MRTSFHHQPEAQHPNVQLSTSWQADYPIFWRQTGHRPTIGSDASHANDGEFNESTQHLLILADEEVCEWRDMHGHGSRRNRRLSCGSAGRAVNVWRTSRERLRGGTRAA